MTTEQFHDSYIPEPNTGCYLWLRARNNHGYGQFRERRVTLYAHRYAYVLSYGSVPKGLDVLHRCDTPSCVNADHLFVGTAKDNMEDCARKARTQHGETHRQAKLTEQQVRDIRRRATKGKHHVLAQEFNVSLATINMIVHGRIWKRVH